MDALSMSPEAAKLGLNGFDDLDDTDPHVGSWYAIKAVGGDAVGAFTMSDGDSLSGYTITENDWLFGPCTGITLTSGEVLAYRTHKA